jgi:A/G-specific adenine glycosylase
MKFENEIISVEQINENEIIHKLTHQKLHIKFWSVSVKGNLTYGISKENLIKLPFSIVIYNFIDKHFIIN